MEKKSGVTRLRNTMDRIIEESFVQPLRGALDAGDGASEALFPVDLVDSGDRFVLRAALPGAQPDDVQVQVQGEILTIKGSVKAHARSEHARWLVRELKEGAFQREIRLPAGVAADRAEAQFEHGLLTLTLPKLTNTGPRRIPIGRKNVDPDDRPKEHSKDPVTVESEASFPASDPPSFTPERA